MQSSFQQITLVRDIKIPQFECNFVPNQEKLRVLHDFVWLILERPQTPSVSCSLTDNTPSQNFKTGKDSLC